MRPGRYIVLSIFSLISLVFVFSALAGFEIHPCYVFNNMYGTVGTRLDASVSSGCLICHMVESNPYGSDIYVYLRECFETSICDEATIEGAIRNVEPFDSDGDGYDNITEINNLTFPSDPSDYPVYASQWAKSYGGSDFENALSIQQTSDGGYIVAGSTDSFGAGNGDAWVLKLDETGDVLWQKTYGGTNHDYTQSIQQTSDGGYIVAGSTYSFGAGNGDIWVLKLDETGNVLWQKTYGGANYDMAKSIQQTLDGGYIAAGYTESFGAGYDDAWVLKLDETGNVLWQKTYGGTQDEEAKFIQQTSDGGYIVAGWIFSFFNTIYESDFWVLKLDSNGGIPDCSIIGTSNAIVNDVSSAVNDTTVTGIDTNVSLQTSSAVTTDTNATVKDTCSPPTIGYSPTSFSFTATQGGLSPSNQSLNIWNEGGETLSWNVSNNATSWLSLNPTSGTDTRTVILSVNIAGLTAGTYNATITITATDATNSPLSVPVALTINASPTPIIDKILGVKEPGGIIRIIGQNFGETQGNSEVHIGPKFYGPGHSKIKLWTDTKIKVKLPNYKCECFNGQDFRYRKIWVTVDGIDSNKKKIKVLKPDTCP
jgi:hypothetical protein